MPITITVDNDTGTANVQDLALDQSTVDPDAIPLIDDGQTHIVTVVLGDRTPRAGQPPARSATESSPAR